MEGGLIPAEDLAITPYRRQPQGGQHVGTETGVQVEHTPTGLVAICRSERSQHRNRNIAIRMIEAALTDPEFVG